MYLLVLLSMSLFSCSSLITLDQAGEIDATIELQRWMNWSMAEDQAVDFPTTLRGEDEHRRLLNTRRQCARALDQVPSRGLILSLQHFTCRYTSTIDSWGGIQDAHPRKQTRSIYAMHELHANKVTLFNHLYLRRDGGQSLR